MDGIVIIDKEKGYTSHDVVAKMRGILHQKKIGHTGTLDPNATGVLPVLLGHATKLSDIFADESKEYEAVMVLGVMTDTQDMTGTIINTSDSYKNLDDQTVREAVLAFVGDYEQLPPMYSALKVKGKKLYEYARQGLEVQRQTRMVKIFDITDIRVNLPYVSMTVSCSKGTYIRTLCNDIGMKLGCFGSMKELRRTRACGFTQEQAVTLDEFSGLSENLRASDALIKLDSVFSFLPAYTAKPECFKFLFNGNPVSKNSMDFLSGESGNKIISGDFSNCARVYYSNGSFMGIYRINRSRECFTPKMLFYSGN